MSLNRIKSHHKKIAIVGCAGSGKTTLALQLKEELNLPLYHLDQYYWKSGWERVGLETFVEIHDSLCEQDEWIIEGSYVKCFYKRAMYADVIIFLDAPRYKCLWYVIKRSVFNFGKVIPGNSENCKQQIFSLKFLAFLKWVWNFNNRYRHMILYTLDELKDTKQIYILKLPKETLFQ